MLKANVEEDVRQLHRQEADDPNNTNDEGERPEEATHVGIYLVVPTYVAAWISVLAHEECAHDTPHEHVEKDTSCHQKKILHDLQTVIREHSLQVASHLATTDRRG